MAAGPRPPASGRCVRSHRRIRQSVARIASILTLGLQSEQVLSEHAAGRIPVEADMGAGGVAVAPEALQRVVEEKPLAAGSEKQRVDGLQRQPHAKRLITAVA